MMGEHGLKDARREGEGRDQEDEGGGRDVNDQQHVERGKMTARCTCSAHTVQVVLVKL